MNVVTAAPAPTARVRGTAAGPTTGGDEFAVLLAGLGGAEPTGTTPPEHADAPSDAPLPDAEGRPDAGAPVVPAGLAAPVPAQVAPATCEADGTVAPQAARPASAAPGVDQRDVEVTGLTGVGARATAAPAVTSAAGPSGTLQGAAATPAPTGPGRPDVPPSTTAAATTAPGTGAGVPAPAERAVTSALAPAPAGAAALPVDPAAPAGAPAPATAAPSVATATTTVPEAVELSVPTDVSSDPVPALDVRSTASPAAPTAAAQTAGTAVVEAMLPAEAAPAAAPSPADAPSAAAPPVEAAPAGPVTSVAAGAEAGVAGPQAADVRPSAPAAPAATPAPPPAAQVVQVLAPVLAGPDGSYSLSLQLYPEELGAVQVEVLLRGGEIRLALHAPDEAAQAALRAALPDLRADLAAGGLSATSLSVDDGRSGQPSDRSDRRPDGRPDGQGDAPGRRPHLYRDAEPGPRQPASHPDAALDLRM